MTHVPSELLAPLQLIGLVELSQKAQNSPAPSQHSYAQQYDSGQHRVSSASSCPRPHCAFEIATVASSTIPTIISARCRKRSHHTRPPLTANERAGRTNARTGRPHSGGPIKINAQESGELLVMSFFQRLLQSWANDAIVKRLANSPTFQRFAYKSVKGVRVACARGVRQGHVVAWRGAVCEPCLCARPVVLPPRCWCMHRPSRAVLRPYNDHHIDVSTTLVPQGDVAGARRGVVCPPCR